jgi:hypothetical protein
VAIGKLSYKQYCGGVIAIDIPQVTYPYRFLASINCSKIPEGNKHTHTHGFEPENINYRVIYIETPQTMQCI